MYEITNKNAKDLIASYDGQKYKFPGNGVTVSAPDDAVHHIFGLDKKDKRDIILRHGWALPADPISKGREILLNFEFRHIAPQYVAPMANEDRPQTSAPEVPEGVAYQAPATPMTGMDKLRALSKK